MRDTKMENVRYFLILAILTIAWLTSGCEASTSAPLVTTTPTAGQVAEEAAPESATPELLTPTGTTMNKTTALPEVAEEIVTPESSPLTTTPALLATATPTAAVGQELTTKTPTPIPPTLTFIPSPTALPEETTPSPAAKALPPLDENLQTIIYTTQGEQGPDIWRVQVDKQGQKAGPVERVDFPSDFRTSVHGLFLSPDGQRVAVWRGYGEGGTSVQILDVASGQLTPLFGKQVDIDQRAFFLDWSPDSQSVLVMGGSGNPDLVNSAWLVNINTHTYHDADIKQVNELPLISDASFSPDGKMITYTQSDCYQCGSEIWRIALDKSDQRLLFQDDKMYVRDVSWSPNGNYIAFTQWLVDSFALDEFATGELHIMTVEGNEERLLSPIMTHFYNRPFRPAWSPDGRQIVFVKSENPESERKLEQFSSNIYTIDILNNQVRQLTDYKNTRVIKPTWSPDGTQVLFLTDEQGLDAQFQPRTITTAGQELRFMDVNPASSEALSGSPSIQPGNLDMNTSIIWLP